MIYNSIIVISMMILNFLSIVSTIYIAHSLDNESIYIGFFWISMWWVSMIVISINSVITRNKWTYYYLSLSILSQLTLQIFY